MSNAIKINYQFHSHTTNILLHTNSVLENVVYHNYTCLFSNFLEKNLKVDTLRFMYFSHLLSSQTSNEEQITLCEFFKIQIFIFSTF